MKKTFLGFCAGFAGLAATVGASELFYIDNHFGSLVRLDTGTLEHELLLHGNDIPNNISSGPSAVAFRSPDTLFISPDGSAPYDATLHHYSFDGEHFTRISTRQMFNNGYRLSGGARGPNGRVFFAARYGDTLWSFGADVHASGTDGVYRNTGPGERFEAATGSYPYFVAYSWLDGRVAVSHTQGVTIFRPDGEGLVLEHSIEISGNNNVEGVAFDVEGWIVTDDGGNEIGRKSLLYISDGSTQSVLRYDATTGEPFGANEEDRSDPVFISAADAGIVDIGNFVVDPSDGHLYLAYASSRYPNTWGGAQWLIARFSRTGQMLNDNAAFIYSDPRSMAFRPTVQQMALEEDGEYVIGPDGLAVRPDAAGLWLTSSMAVQQAMVDFFGVDFVGNLTVGGTESGGIVARLRDGQTLKTIKIEVKANGSVETETDTQLLVDQGLNIDGGRLQAGPGSQVEVGPGQMFEGGLASIISTGGGNIISTGGGNIISTGGGNIISTGGGNIISAGGGNIIAAGGGNLIAAGGGNLISAGGGNFQLNGGSLIGHAGSNLRAGNSPGVFTLLGGSVFLEEKSAIEVEIGGREQGAGYDFYDLQTSLEGTVEINGNLAVLLIDGFADEILPDDSFTVLRAATPIGGEIGNRTADGRIACADGSGSFRLTFAEDGKAIVLDDFQSGSARDAWNGEHFAWTELIDLEIAGNEADPDSDGLVNLGEFAFNLNPRLRDVDGAVGLVDGPEGLQFIYRRRAGGAGTSVDYSALGVRYEMLESIDLVEWLPFAAAAAAVVAPLEDGETETISFPIPAASGDAPKKFFRVRLTEE